MFLITKVKNFIKSFIWHAYSGFPKSSQKLIDERYQICVSCDNFGSSISQCLICGCNINKQKIFMNKLAWKDQKCPIAKW